MLYLPAEFPQDPELCYLNHAAIGPWPRRTAQTVARFAQQNMLRGGADYPEWLATERRLRGRIATLIGAASADDIALSKNTSDGLSIISQGLDWRDGDEVIGVAHDFISNRMPWQALATHGVHYRSIDAVACDDPEGALVDAFTANTRVLAVSSVHYITGYRFDLARLARACKSHGVLFSVDAIQSLGAVPFDLTEVAADFVTSGSHKWLLAPEGLGFMYCRPPLRDTLRLRQYGWAMRESPYDFDADDWTPARSARRFESGTPNMMAIHALDASLGLLEEIGMDAVAERLTDNLTFLIEALSTIPRLELLTPRDPARRAGIVTFRHPAIVAGATHPALMKAGVICSTRGGGIRFSPHFYSPRSVLENAIERLLRVL